MGHRRFNDFLRLEGKTAALRITWLARLITLLKNRLSDSDHEWRSRDGAPGLVIATSLGNELKAITREIGNY